VNRLLYVVGALAAIDLIGCIVLTCLSKPVPAELWSGFTLCLGVIGRDVVQTSQAKKAAIPRKAAPKKAP
jgi:hypothetical protein